MRILLLAVILFTSFGCAGLRGLPRFQLLESVSCAPCFLPEVETEARPSRSSGGIGTYFRDRANDFVDIFSLSLSLGFGAIVNVRATQFVQCGGLFFDGSKVGFMGRQAGTWTHSECEMGIPGFYIRSVEIMPDGKSVKRICTDRGQSWFFQLCGDEGVPYDYNYDRRLWQVGASVHAILLGIDFSVDLKELLDFLLGWSTLDIANDDTNSAGNGDSVPEEPASP
jgi:hypothetical protein